MRCQLDDGPSEEEIKKVVRICMRKLGDNSDRNNSENSYEDSDEENDNRNDYNHGKNNNNNNNNNNRGNRFARHADMMGDRWQQQEGYDNVYGNRNQQRYDNNYYGNNGNNGFDMGNNYGHPSYDNRNHNLSNRNRNYDRNNMEDKSCMMQCFFQEMKMVKQSS